jgi:hypothetical protein
VNIQITFDPESSIGRSIIALLASHQPSRPVTSNRATEAVKDFLRSRGGQARHAEIGRHMRASGFSGGWAAPKRLLLQSREIERVGRGLYRLVEQPQHH